MIAKNFFELQEDDVKNMKTASEVYKSNILDLIKNVNGLTYTVSDFYKLDKQLEEEMSSYIQKYAMHFYANSDEKISANFQEMSKASQEVSFYLYQNKDFYDFIKALKTEDSTDEMLKMYILKAFENSGLSLTEDKQKELNEKRTKLTELSMNFNKNIAMHKSESKLVLDELLKKSLTEHDKKWFEGKEELKYDDNLFIEILETGESPLLRERIYNIRNSIAAKGSVYDNTDNIKNILCYKQQLAEIMGKKDFTEMALENRMAKTSVEVIDFLENLNNVMRPMAEKESAEFKNFVKHNFNIEDIKFSDKLFYSNLYSEQKFDYKKDSVREYFTFNNVLSVAFNIIENLYGITFEKTTDIELPYEQTESYKVFNDGVYKGILIADFFARNMKNSGAWVSGLQPPSASEEGLVTINANFNSAKPGLTVYEIVTLFHEFGHAVHHFSSNTKFSSLSGTSNMARDAVEIPSQMLEKFGEEHAVLKEISRFSGNEIPDDLIEKALSVEKDGMASFYARQLSFALFDMLIYGNSPLSAKDLFNEVSARVLPSSNLDKETNFENRFSHIFSGGYSAGYYSYLWADVYSVDAYMFIKENEDVNKDKFKTFLSKGSSVAASELYKEFRGEDVSLNNFLSYYGMAEPVLNKKKKFKM